MSWVFLPRDDEPLGARIVRCCHEALDDVGRISSIEHVDRARSVQSANVADPHVDELIRLHTTCGVFVRGILGWCGVDVSAGWHPGQPLLGGWVPMVMRESDGWTPYSPTLTVEPGAVFVLKRPWHVGFFLEGGGVRDELATAEGGGGHDGTEAHLSTRAVARWQHGRQLLGVFQPSGFA